MRKALIVGINYYEHTKCLSACVNDAQTVNNLLLRHENGMKNFDTLLLASKNSTEVVMRTVLKDRIEELFKSEGEIALLYFAGHGHIESSGGYILSSEAKRGDEGVSLTEILTYANESKAKNKIIVLDSCHSGIAGSSVANKKEAVLEEGIVILTASTAEQAAIEGNDHGIFTSLFIDALRGGAANLTGAITPGSIYAHVDQSLGEWGQRPIFKANVKQFVSIRNVRPSIELEDLRRISEFFPTQNHPFKLNPTFEPELKGRDSDTPPPDPTNMQIFAILQQYNRLNLLVPVDSPHMWHAAMESKSCKLTALGEHYRRLAEKGRI